MLKAYVLFKSTLYDIKNRLNSNTEIDYKA